MSSHVPRRRNKTRFFVIAYLSGMLAIHAASFWRSRNLIAKGYPDFTTYYATGTMVRRGLGNELYDTALQSQVQRELAPDVAIRKDALPYLHPPFEALVFVPFTYFSYLRAFIAWDLVNVSVLLLVAFLLSRNVSKFDQHSWPFWLLASLAFFPIFLTLLQGQDSIFLLLLFTLVFICLKKKRDKLAGVFLALGLFRPQLILPFLVLWLSRKGKNILVGFLPTAGLLALLSLPIVGAVGLLSYPNHVFHIDRTKAQGALRPSDMPNLRGLIHIFAPDAHTPWVVFLSLAILLLVVWRLRASQSEEALLDWNFSLAIFTTTVLSYYCLGHDLSILFLPIAIITPKLSFREKTPLRVPTLIICGMLLLFFSPLQLFLIGRHQFGLMGWAVLLVISGILAQPWDLHPHNSTPVPPPLVHSPAGRRG